MITPKRTSAHLPTGGILAAAAVSLLLATLPLAAQDRSNSRPSDSSDHGRTASESHGSYAPSAPSPERSYTPPPSSSGSDSSGWRRSDSSSSSSDNRGGKPRTAVPLPPGSPDAGGGANRQPPNRRDDRGRGGFGHHGHGGYYSGPYYYPYGSFWWNVFWGYPYYYDWEYPRYGYYGYGSGYRDEDFGALDLDVSPARTQVFLDGQYIGTVDDFDGWPRYLWLEKGTYDLVLYLDGYKTDARQISVYPGLVIDIDDHMEPGESIKPQDLQTKTHDRRDSRQRYETERREELDRRGRSGDDDDRDDDEWRSRARRHRVVIEREEMSEDADGRDSEVSENAGSGTVKLSIEPDDASVYLDGKFIGTGADLAKMASGLPVEAGDHKLAVVRPGRKDENVTFKVKAGAEVDLEIELEERGGS